MLRLDTETIVSLYQGALSVNFVESFRNGNKTFTFRADKLQVGEHPIPKAYSVVGTLTMEAGETEAVFFVTLLDDSVEEVDEIARLEWGNVLAAEGNGGGLVTSIAKLDGDTWREGTAALYALGLVDFERFWVPAFVRENLLAMRRAGADAIITYHARDALQGGWL